MRILALDSSLGGCSVALWTDDGDAQSLGRVIAGENEATATGQAERLAPMIAKVVEGTGGFAAIDRFAATIGPGYFTGLRAGLATARGLALAAGRPLIGITTLAAVAAGVPSEQRRGRTLVVALDSKRSEAFFQSFGDDLAAQGEPETMAPAAFVARLKADPGRAHILVAGTATPLLAPALDAAGLAWTRADAPERPEAVTVARLARTAPVPDAPPAPLYLHAPATTTPRTGAGRPEAARARSLVTQ